MNASIALRILQLANAVAQAKAAVADYHDHWHSVYGDNYYSRHPENLDPTITTLVNIIDAYNQLEETIYACEDHTRQYLRQ